jgi:hypothetical protein
LEVTAFVVGNNGSRRSFELFHVLRDQTESTGLEKIVLTLPSSVHIRYFTSYKKH